MTFLNPNLLLAGAACVALPILVHLLLRRRRRPVQWAAMRFLLEAYKQQRRRMKLEQFLLLAARCLLILLVALAVGRPVLEGLSGLSPRAPREVFILIDNSLTSIVPAAGGAGGPAAASGGSSANRDLSGSVLEKHKKAAAELVRTLDASRGDRVALVTLAGPAESMVLPPSNDLSGVATLISNIQPSDSAADWEGASALISPHARAEAGVEPPVVAIFSGFRQGSTDVSVDPSARLGQPDAGTAGSVPPGGSIRVLATAPEETPASNTMVVGADLLEGVLLGSQASEAGGTASVRVQLTRSGELSETSGAVRAWITERDELPADNQIGRETLAWAKGEREKTVIVRTPLDPRRAARPLLYVGVDRDAIEADNLYRRPIAVRDQLRVAIVGVPGSRTQIDPSASVLERFGPADWTALALEPREDDPIGGRRSQIAVAWTEPAGVGTLAADNLDAIVLTAPDKVLEADWRHLASLRASGVVIVVVPPRDEKVHLWSDALRSAFALDWDFSRESREFNPPRTMAWEGKPRPTRDLLAQIGGEMAELSRDVTVERMLAITSPSADVQVWAADARSEAPLILSASPAVRAGETAPSGAASVPPGAAASSGAVPPAVASGAGTSAQGALIVFAASLDLSWTTLPARPLMVPLMQELVRQGVGASSAGRAGIAGSRLPAPGGAAQLRPITPSRDGVLSVAADGLTAIPVRSAGAWLGVDPRGATLAKSGLLTANADPRAGRVLAQPRESVQRWLARYAGLPTSAIEPGTAPDAPFRWLDSPETPTPEGAPPAQVLESTGRGSPWSLPLFAAALVVALAELVMARVFSHAKVSSDSGLAMPGRAGA